MAKALLETRRYDAAILPELESFIADGKNYDADVHLAALKLYQFNPQLLKTETVATVLAKALMRLPESDFLACTYLVPERVLDAEPVSQLVSLATLLEQCKFRDVWPALEPLSGILKTLPEFEAGLRNFMLRTFEITYQSMPPAHLQASLGLGHESRLAALVEPRGWKLEGGLYKVALSDDNKAKPKHVESGDITVHDMTKVLASITSAAS